MNAVRATRSIVAAALLIVAGAAPAPAQRSSARPSDVVQTDFILRMSDGVYLDCTKFIPAGAKPKAGWPALLYLHGYADSKYAELQSAHDQAQFGYYTLAYSMRGQGYSEGLSHLISRVEMQDLLEVIDYVRKDTAADPDRIGLFGGSQGGILPFMAACYGAPVRCVLSDLASPAFASSWIENGCVKTTLFFSVDYDSASVRYAPEVKNIRRWILSKQSWAWDSLAAAMPRNRDFADRVPQCAVPVLFTNAWEDKFFNASGVIRAAPDMRVPFRMYFGAVDGHGSDTTKFLNKFISAWDNSWIEYWLNDRRNGVLDSSRYYYAAGHRPVVKDGWTYTLFRSPEWPPSGIAPYSLYLHPDRRLTASQNSSSVDSVMLLNDVRDSNLTMQQVVNSGFQGSFFTSRFVKRALIFESDTMAQDFQFVGVPELELYYSSTGRVCQFNAQILDARGINEAHMVTRIDYTDRHCVPGEIRSARIEGLACSHIFRRGDRLRLVLTNLDTDPADSFLVTNPYVLPVLERAENMVYMSPERPTRLILPVRDLTTSRIAAAKPRAPAGGLSNYPDPFSDRTTLLFTIERDNTTARLDLYDTLGRLVKHGSDRQFDAGPQRWDIPLAQLPPGVYFCRLTAGNFQLAKTIHKME